MKTCSTQSCTRPTRPSRNLCGACQKRSERRAKASTLAQGPSGTHAESPAPQIAAGLELRAQTVHTNAEGGLLSRYDKSGLARPDEPAFEVIPHGHHVTKTTTRIDADGRVGMQYVTAKHDDVIREAEMVAAWQRHASLYAGLATAAPDPYCECDEDLITLYPLGDPHIGMLSWAEETGQNFDTKIACEELLTCVDMLVEGAEASAFAIICNLGDFLHAQDDSRRTPGSGNVLDVDGRHSRVLDMGHALLRGIVDRALRKHRSVVIRNLPGNHDPRVAAELAMWLRAVYENEPRLFVADAFMPHQYDRFGDNLFGWHHGDRTPAKELVQLMSADCAEDWGQSTTRVYHVGHVHHKKSDAGDHMGGTVEYHRNMAPNDFWHQGRYRSKQSTHAITYHKIDGEVARKTVPITRVHRALSAAGRRTSEKKVELVNRIM